MIKKPYDELSEGELVAASLDGDEGAFGEIINRYRKMVARTVKGMLGDSVFSEDIGQDVFVKLYYSLSEFRGESKLSTYIQRIAINMTLNELKRRKRFFSLFSQKENDEMYEMEIADCDYNEKREASETVNKALKALDPNFRVIVMMRMLQGYSVKETSEILGLPQGTVLSRLSRAQKQLKDILINI
ncbi:MAG TPA: RNA polymerase sigma factor [Bacteroidales bacterium]|nr:RNA polymerase sigma factor [Bacteroidales bacterium]HPT22040.1 RNA polymerase sigma factor [Bacteroidales bacterium]